MCGHAFILIQHIFDHENISESVETQSYLERKCNTVLKFITTMRWQVIDTLRY